MERLGEVQNEDTVQHVVHSWHIIVTYPLKNNNYTDTIRGKLYMNAINILIR